MEGADLLESLRLLPAGMPAAAFLRHAARHSIVDVSDPAAAELTDAGVAAAEVFGTRITGFDRIRLFHSPVKRCRQTAECVARGARTAGLDVELVGPENALGIDYILDKTEAGRLTLEHGDHFVRLWFTGQITPEVIQPAPEIVRYKLAHLTRRLADPGAGRRLDLHVSHDWNIIVLREHVVGVRHEDVGWLDFLDGVAFAAAGDGFVAAYHRHVVTYRPAGESRRV